ncbi:MAG: hypothetical protein DYG84_03485 [Candidatus Brocadia sp. AMX3]|nr:hypothetical protein [Candidatus Brocadia sp. AMX3]
MPSLSAPVAGGYTYAQFMEKKKTGCPGMRALWEFSDSLPCFLLQDILPCGYFLKAHLHF